MKPNMLVNEVFDKANKIAEKKEAKK